MQPKPEKPPQGRLFSLEPLQADKAAAKPLEEAVLQRGSSRRFLRQEISFVELSLMLETAIRDFPSDWLAPNGALMSDVYLNVHAVDGLPAGAYIFRPQDHALELLKTGNFRSESAFLCLGQDLGGDSSATLFFLADLEVILERYGNRGYRLAQMEAGILGGKLYLSAYALGRGATGLTFYDDEVVSFFSPHSAGKEAMFVTALGAPGRPGRRDGRMIRILPGESRE
jgi:SagB-type dehydrogenase family enzyme